MRWRRFGFFPTVRYTRWQQDPPLARAVSRADQIEFLMSFVNHPDRDALPYTNRLSVGAVLGVNFLKDYFSQVNVFHFSDPNGNPTSSGGSYASSSGRRSFLVGPTIDVGIGRGWSIEADAIYRPMRVQVAESDTINGQMSRNSFEASATTWQFPVMAKY